MLSDNNCHIKVVYYGSGTYLNKPLIIPLALTHDIADRLKGVEHFLGILQGKTKPMDDRRLTMQQKQRLIKMLQTFDARQENAPAREIAGAVFGEHFLSSGAEWKTSATRFKTLRLLRDSKLMVTDGYLKLLQYHHRQKLD